MKTKNHVIETKSQVDKVDLCLPPEEGEGAGWSDPMTALVEKVRARVPKHYEHYCVLELVRRLPDKMVEECGLRGLRSFDDFDQRFKADIPALMLVGNVAGFNSEGRSLEEARRLGKNSQLARVCSATLYPLKGLVRPYAIFTKDTVTNEHLVIHNMHVYRYTSNPNVIMILEVNSPWTKNYVMRTMVEKRSSFLDHISSVGYWTQNYVEHVLPPRPDDAVLGKYRHFDADTLHCLDGIEQMSLFEVLDDYYGNRMWRLRKEYRPYCFPGTKKIDQTNLELRKKAYRIWLETHQKLAVFANAKVAAYYIDNCPYSR